MVNKKKNNSNKNIVKKSNETKKKIKKGRPKGSKSKSGIPTITIMKAIEYVKEAYDKFKEMDNKISFNETSELMNLKKGSNTPVIGNILKYGFIENSNGIYSITETGKKAISGDKTAVIYALKTNDILSKIYDKFPEGGSPGLIEGSIKGKHNYEKIAQTYIETIDFIKGLSNKGIENQASANSKHINYPNLIQLNFVLNPPNKNKIPKLIEGVCKELENEDDTIKQFANSMKSNKDNEDSLRLLFNNIFSILSKRHPQLNLNEEDNEQSETETKKLK